jgi:hypothetical protein
VEEIDVADSGGCAQGTNSPFLLVVIFKIWEALKPWAFTSTYGGFQGTEVHHVNLKGRVLESMKIQVKAEGWEKHEILGETCE